MFTFGFQNLPAEINHLVVAWGIGVHQDHIILFAIICPVQGGPVQFHGYVAVKFNDFFILAGPSKIMAPRDANTVETTLLHAPCD